MKKRKFQRNCEGANFIVQCYGA